jgi:hypothetical protein
VQPLGDQPEGHDRGSGGHEPDDKDGSDPEGEVIKRNHRSVPGREDGVQHSGVQRVDTEQARNRDRGSVATKEVAKLSHRREQAEAHSHPHGDGYGDKAAPDEELKARREPGVAAIVDLDDCEAGPRGQEHGQCAHGRARRASSDDVVIHVTPPRVGCLDDEYPAPRAECSHGGTRLGV